MTNYIGFSLNESRKKKESLFIDLAKLGRISLEVVH